MSTFLREAVRKHQEDIHGRWKWYFFHKWGKWEKIRKYYRGDNDENITGFLYERTCRRCELQDFKKVMFK